MFVEYSDSSGVFRLTDYERPYTRSLRRLYSIKDRAADFQSVTYAVPTFVHRPPRVTSSAKPAKLLGMRHVFVGQLRSNRRFM